MISRENILRKTMYGAGIYAYILRAYYPNETVMHITGRDCGVCRNPFAGDALTLHIWIEKLHPELEVSEELACHSDSSETIPDGCCFDFAQRHYGLAGQELLNAINKDMFLHLEEGYCAYPPKTTNGNVGNASTDCIRFSFFKAPVTNARPFKDITIRDAYNYITGNFAKKRTEELRSIAKTDPKRAKWFKAVRFDYCCFSGTFRSRSNSALIEHSGYLCIDFDHVSNLEELFRALLDDEYFDTQLLFRSPSGDGLKWVIPINVAEMPHGDYFRAVESYIRATYSINIDASGKDISRACFLPYDPFAFINTKFLE